MGLGQASHPSAYRVTNDDRIKRMRAALIEARIMHADANRLIDAVLAEDSHCGLCGATRQNECTAKTAAGPCRLARIALQA